MLKNHHYHVEVWSAAGRHARNPVATKREARRVAAYERRVFPRLGQEGYSPYNEVGVSGPFGEECHNPGR